MLKILVFLLISLCCTCLIGCGAPDDSENGPVKKFNLSARQHGNEYMQDFDSDTATVVHRIKTRGIKGSLGRTFNDKNDLQLTAASAIGINPVHSLNDAYNIKLPIRKIATCEDFFLDSLTHSMPYLVPKAANLLHDIGKAFSDTILSRGGRKCQIIVTSVLRTDNTINRLKRRNVNATTSSCHMFGTTFDISWLRFHHCDSTYIMHTGDLKNILAEVLYEMRKQGRCYVKYERKQSCFHITTR
ncbi:MAG: hypothetical protein IJ328_07725 [Muribaculaceae bacterium]|nr:hypothetical protein [Muribaculaceae bacterium]